jgi:hypothetical protein
VAADIYWLRTVQYFGGQRVFAEGKDFSLLLPLIDITTTLDPRLEIAYRYGAIFLCEGKPYGAGRPEEGIRLLEKGARALPLSWRLREDLGFYHFFYLRDAEKASEVLLEATKIPGAAFWLRSMAADLLLKGGHRRKSRQMWEEMLRYSDEGVLKANAAVHLAIIDAREQADAAAEAVGQFQKQFGRRPEDLLELRAKLHWRGPISDSKGVPFEYDASTGTVVISRQSPLWRPPLAGD